jgi:hypothetical protein
MNKRMMLVCAAMLAALPAAFAKEPKAADPCFKRAFEKTTSTGRWLVKQCGADGVDYFQVEFRDAKLQQFNASFSDSGTDGIVDTNYVLVAPDTLSIDQMAERGGRIFLLHPVEGGKELSTLKVPYMNPDEGGKFDLKKTGNTIRFKTNEDDVTVAIDLDGRLSRVARPARKK